MEIVINIKIIEAYNTRCAIEIGQSCIIATGFGKNLIAIKGAIPGAKDGIVFIRDSVKA